jgi:predicted nuclease of predicted toxin-antitoxin system
VRFLIDESMSARVAELLVVAGHDAVYVGDLGLLGAPDTHVMVAARQSGRSVVSADTDFGEL